MQSILIGSHIASFRKKKDVVGKKSSYLALLKGVNRELDKIMGDKCRGLLAMTKDGLWACMPGMAFTMSELLAVWSSYGHLAD